MTKPLNKYLILTILALAPLVGYASEEPVKQVHKPPILTTTAIIEDELAFDHAQVLKDYIDWRNGNESLAMPKP